MAMISRSALIVFAILLLIPSHSQASSQSSLKQSDWVLVWSDEFEGNKLDLGKWSYEIDCWGGGNNERQCYTDREKNIRVEDGFLKIIARKERYKGAAVPPRFLGKDDAAKIVKRKFTSGRIVTLGKGDWTYGRVEIRAKLPGGQGVWPAIWMLPSDKAYGTWAASGEIDIMEAVNLGAHCKVCPRQRENRIHGTLHYGGKWPDNTQSGHATVLPGATEDFHTYAIEWSEGKISWFVDDNHYASQTSQDWYSQGITTDNHPHAPFDQQFHIILNLAIGGNWPEASNQKGVSRRGFPKIMDVDWVRVYECASDPDTGKTCAK